MKKTIDKILFKIFLKLLKRELKYMDQWARWKLKDQDSNMEYYVTMSLKGDEYNWTEIDF